LIITVNSDNIAPEQDFVTTSARVVAEEPPAPSWQSHGPAPVQISSHHHYQPVNSYEPSSNHDASSQRPNLIKDLY
jgi:urease beta subunit